MAERVGRGSLTGKWKPRLGGANIRGGIMLERDVPGNTTLWLTGWTKAIPGGEVVWVLVEIADKYREAAPDADRRSAPTARSATGEAHCTLRCDRVSGDAIDTEAVGSRQPFAPLRRRAHAPSSQAAPPGNALFPHLVTRNANRRAHSQGALEPGRPSRSRSTPVCHRCPYQHGLGRYGVTRNGASCGSIRLEPAMAIPDLDPACAHGGAGRG